MPHFDYASILLLFLSNSQKRKLLTMHRRCLRSAARDYTSPMSQLLSDFDTVEINVRWHMALFRTMQAVEHSIRKLQNCVNEKEFLHDAHTCPGLAPIVFYDLFTLSQNARRNVFVQPHVRTVKHGERSVRFYGTSFWNKVPHSLRVKDCRSPTVMEFLKKFLEKQSGIQNSIYA